MLIEHIGKLYGDELDDFLDEYFGDDPSRNPLPNNFIGEKSRGEMTEREQMLFVIKHLKNYINTIQSSSGFYMEEYEEVERQNYNLNCSYKTSGNIYKADLAYRMFGEYFDWEFDK